MDQFIFTVPKESLMRSNLAMRLLEVFEAAGIIHRELDDSGMAITMNVPSINQSRVRATLQSFNLPYGY